MKEIWTDVVNGLLRAGGILEKDARGMDFNCVIETFCMWKWRYEW